MWDALEPTVTLREMFGAAAVYVPRADRRSSQWFASDPATLDFYTGGQLAIAGEMPIVCSAGVVTPVAREVMGEAGLRVGPVVTYRDESEFTRIVNAQAQTRRLVVQHRLPQGAAGDDQHWIPPALHSWLNNKANLAELVPAEHVCLRRTLRARDAFAAAVTLPRVLKVATDYSTGGGAAVALCRSSEDVEAARVRFAEAEWIVVEPLLDIAENLCLTCAVFADGKVRYLGHSIQEVTAVGQYLGNWFDLDAEVSRTERDLAVAIAGRAANLGYRGVVGIDVARLSDGTRVVLDLNFRVNGSTAALLLLNSIRRTRRVKRLHLCTWADDDFETLIERTRAAVKAGSVIPLTIFDAAAAGFRGQPSRVRALEISG